MDVKLYNSLTHRIEVFEPLRPGEVSMYNCGPTVYDFAHIGNFRSFLFADLLRRTLEFVGYRVKQVMNLTDVGHMTEDEIADGGGQDKMELAARRLKQAKKRGEADVANPDDPYQVAQYFIDAFIEDARRLRLRVADEPDHLPRATDHIDRMIRLIERLLERDHAYVTADGVVYFDVASFPEYGKLSGNTTDRLMAGAGGRLDPQHQDAKRNPADFLLWKRDERHLMKWDSPWGEGYPGWHIECSAMAMGLLEAETIDIHTGGEDNLFPHHECEIAQSTGATGKPFARYWLHARHLMVEGEKMSKSKGNFHTVRDLLSRGVEPAVLRFELLKAPYRQNANFTFKGLADSERQIRRLRDFAGRVVLDTSAQGFGSKMGDSSVERDFAAALADDLNMSKALGVLNAWIHTLASPDAADVAALGRMDHVLGVLAEDDRAASPQPDGGLTDAEINARCAAMHEARQKKDYATSDAIRDELLAAGVEVQIARDGVTWRRKMQLD